jgi:hypothetical protein
MAERIVMFGFYDNLVLKPRLLKTSNNDRRRKKNPVPLLGQIDIRISSSDTSPRYK